MLILNRFSSDSYFGNRLHPRVKGKEMFYYLKYFLKSTAITTIKVNRIQTKKTAELMIKQN